MILRLPDMPHSHVVANLRVVDARLLGIAKGVLYHKSADRREKITKWQRRPERISTHERRIGNLLKQLQRLAGMMH
jgi:hypothetical protein